LKQKYTAYVIDADTSARRGISRLLFTAGYKIKAHSSLKEFVEILGPDISGFIILDAGASRMTRAGLLSALREHSLSMPIIVVSDEADASARNKARELKAVGFFRKPVDGKALLDTIKWVTKENMQDLS
jgi:FixJ family two-component response regulator